MAAVDRTQPYDDDQDALIKQLGGGKPNVSTTMPVTPTTTDPRDPRFTSANAPRVSQGASGQWQLQEHGNTRPLVGDEVERAKAYAEQFWKDNPTGWQANNPTSLNDIYQQVLGRDADAAGLAAHQKNPGGFAGAVSTIVNSDEANQYRNAHPITALGGATATSPTTGAATTPPPAAGGAVTPQTFQGFTPKYAMEGFNTEREQNTGKSAKDAFAYLANQAPPPPLQDKAALGAWFKQYIEPGMNALGHKVNSVNGDSFNFSNWQGQFDVDYGRGAGAPNGALAWQVQEPTAQMAQNPTYQAQGQRLVAPPPMSSQAAPGGDSMQQIRDEIAAIQNGAASPIDQQALEALLQQR